MALIRSLLAVLRRTTSRPTGTIIAPPTPWSTRMATSSGRPVLAAHRIEAAVNREIAAANTVRAPYRSAAQPLIGMNTAKVTR